MNERIESLGFHHWARYQARAWTRPALVCYECGTQMRPDNAHDLCLGLIGELLLDPDEASRVPVRWRGGWEERRRRADDYHRRTVDGSRRWHAKNYARTLNP